MEVLSVKKLSKQYQLGVVGTGTIRHDLNRWWHKLRGKEDPYLKVTDQDNQNYKNGFVWALKDIDFQLSKGEVLGVIGNNGAGKSTLLKILSQVTTPTSGIFKARGRIASLLEVGTGFHQELTGRENIFLNGAILGMTKAEVRRKLDEIISFSGVERYIDTPVKRYSSGMKVRLAFAVAAHLEPEILIVDEVLAVGDAAFQKKAIGKMQEVSQGEGRTVLFVSHNMAAVSRLCTRGLVLNKGEVVFDGGVKESIQRYAQLNLETTELSIKNRKDRKGLGECKFTSIEIEDEQNQKNTKIRTGSEFRIHAGVTCSKTKKEVYASITFRDATGKRLFSLSTSFYGRKVSLQDGTLLSFKIPKMPLSEGEYLCDLYMAEGRGDTLVQDHLENAFKIEVFGNDFFGSGDPQPVGLDLLYVDFSLTKNNSEEIIKDKV